MTAGQGESAVARGACRCGGYRFEAVAEPFMVSYCHCTDCRAATGAPVTVFIGFREASLGISGQPAAVYRSAPGIERLFCAGCGTPIGYRDAGLADEMYYYLGMLEDPSRYVPRLHAFVSERLPWLEIRDELPRHERFSRARGSGTERTENS